MLNAILNTIFVSIPEEIVWVVLILILLKRDDLLDKDRIKQNIKLLLLPILTMAILINIFRYIIIIPRLLATLFTLIIFGLLIIYVIKKTDKIKKTNTIKILLCLLLSSCFMVFTDGLVAPFLTYYLNVPITNINNNIILNILASFIPRIIQVFILFFLLTKRYKMSFLGSVIKNKFTMIITNSFLGIMLVFWFFIMMTFGNYLTVQNFSVLMKIISGIVIIFIPFALISLFIGTIVYFTNYIDQKERYHSNELDDIDNN